MHTNKEIEVNRCPGDTKLSTKWQSTGDSTKEHYFWPFAQIINYSGKTWNTRYGYLITQRELVVLRISRAVIGSGIAQTRSSRTPVQTPAGEHEGTYSPLFVPPSSPVARQSTTNDRLPIGLIDEDRPGTHRHGGERDREIYLGSHAQSNGSSLQGPQQHHRSSDVNRAGQRKQPSTGSNERKRRPYKRQRLEETTSSPTRNSCDALRIHFLSLPTNARLEFLSWLFEGSLPQCTFGPEITASITPAKRKVNTGVRKQVRWATSQGNAGNLDDSGSLEKSRKGMPWLPEEESLLLELRNTRGLPWSDITRLFSDQYPGRSQGSIQVHWSTKLKGRQS
ncbi:uncharacterized protein CIMG_03634 [Coccidioides immitis RS]|uniref:Myb-like domain-containing protein n=1 Tax=Coccidioides immitis (strain RS) TaxID=246410 RepID=A0A0D8JW30_COCIM|nr:uncharacterized protein CIMG_03634 [Coccidioides immitis RS]KJF61535.1 hypothetical protein CIMG_03634 [Coccidioides immitis RS]